MTLEPVGPVEAPTVTVLSSAALEIGWERTAAARRGYHVFRAPSADGPFEHVASPGESDPIFGWNVDTYVDEGLMPATTYFYHVAACNEHGCALDPSPVVGGTTDTGG